MCLRSDGNALSKIERTTMDCWTAWNHGPAVASRFPRILSPSNARSTTRAPRRSRSYTSAFGKT